MKLRRHSIMRTHYTDRLKMEENFINEELKEIDKKIGYNVKTLRSQKPMSQAALGKSIGVTFQQLQKYERATNRIAASRLYQTAKVLGVNISYFFDDNFSEELNANLIDPARYAKELIALDSIKDKKAKNKLSTFIREFAEYHQRINETRRNNHEEERQ